MIETLLGGLLLSGGLEFFIFLLGGRVFVHIRAFFSGFLS